jgi:hypothetical protein
LHRYRKYKSPATVMNTEKETMSPQQSLDLITEMINQAKGNVKSNSFYYLLWGWVIVLANLGAYILLQLDYENPYIVWLIVIPAWIASFVKGVTSSRKTNSSTHIDKINIALWISYGVFATLLPFFGPHINFQINPINLLVGGLCTFVSGFILRFNMLLAGGIIIFIGGITSFFLGQENQLLMASVAFGIGYLVPGYLLKYQP